MRSRPCASSTEQEAAEKQAVASATEAMTLVLNQYAAGTVSMSTVITAETALLSNRQVELTARQNELTAAVDLVVALGGGWSTAQLPAPGSIGAGSEVPPAPGARPAPRH